MIEGGHESTNRRCETQYSRVWQMSVSFIRDEIHLFILKIVHTFRLRCTIGVHFQEDISTMKIWGLALCEECLF